MSILSDIYDEFTNMQKPDDETADYIFVVLSKLTDEERDLWDIECDRLMELRREGLSYEEIFPIIDLEFEDLERLISGNARPTELLPMLQDNI